MEPTTTHVLDVIKKRTSGLNTAVMIITPIALIVGGFFWYKNNIWRPEITLVSVDWVNSVAELMVNGKQAMLYAGSTHTASFGWGVRFSGKLFDTYDRIEIVKNELTYKTLSVKP